MGGGPEFLDHVDVNVEIDVVGSLQMLGTNTESHLRAHLERRG